MFAIQALDTCCSTRTCALRLHQIALAAAFALIGCSAPEAPQNNGQTAANNDNSSGGRTTSMSANNGGNGADDTNHTTQSVESCGTVRLDLDTGERTFADCEESAAGWACVCDGSSVTSDAGECEDALVEACGVTANDLASCFPQSGAICVPRGDQLFACQCDDEEPVVDAPGESCRAAGWLACNSACVVGQDACKPVVSPEPGSYECECEHYNTTRTKYLPSDCENAARLLCRPGGGVDGCTGWKGYCDQVTSPEFGFECTCLDGSSRFLTPEQLGGADDCQLALVETCGEDTPPPGYYCDAQSGDRSGSCTRDTDDAGNTVYRCNCRQADAMNASNTSETVAAASCDDALADVCRL